MCDTCGCGSPGEVPRIIKTEDLDNPQLGNHDHDHGSHSHFHGGHSHSHGHGHTHSHSVLNGVQTGVVATDLSGQHTRQITLELDIMQRNNRAAETNRMDFTAKGILALNLVSSPGSGKTSLLERTIRSLPGETGAYVVEGDQQTTNDARRIRDAGAPVVQINTGNGCHLEAEMVGKAVKELNPSTHSILFIENVGNLVCPALFDLGEESRVVVISVTEGEDKPLKYPNMFQSSQLCIINKTDLLPYVDFNVAKAREYALQVNPTLQFIELSVRSGEGFDRWIDWLQSKMHKG